MSAPAAPPAHWRNAAIALFGDLVIAAAIIVAINNPDSGWTLANVVVIIWVAPWVFRMKAGLFHYLSYRWFEKRAVTDRLHRELVDKRFPRPGEHYDLAEDYFAEVATDEQAPVEARIAAARYLGADAGWAQTQQIQTRWLFNKAALEAIARHRGDSAK